MMGWAAKSYGKMSVNLESFETGMFWSSTYLPDVPVSGLGGERRVGGVLDHGDGPLVLVQVAENRGL